MMRKFSHILVFFLSITTLVSCKCFQKNSNNQELTLENTEWKLLKLNNREYSPILNQPEELLLILKDGYYNTSNGCNALGGEYKISNNNIEFFLGRTTLIKCSDEMSKNFFGVPFHNITKFEIKKDRLYFLSKDEKIIAEYIKK